MQKWEYRVIERWLTEDELNALGAAGWELVVVLGYGEWNVEVRAYLKRKISN